MDLGPHFQAKLAHLGAKLAIKAPLDVPLGAFGQHLGAKEAPKSAKKSFKRGLDGQPGAKMDQLGSKMGSQIC